MTADSRLAPADVGLLRERFGIETLADLVSTNRWELRSAAIGRPSLQSFLSAVLTFENLEPTVIKVGKRDITLNALDWNQANGWAGPFEVAGGSSPYGSGSRVGSLKLDSSAPAAGVRI